MTIEEAKQTMYALACTYYGKEFYEKENEAIKIACKSLEAWEHLNNKIQSIKIMKERELDTAGDLTTAYILRGEIGVLEVIITLISEQFSEVER